MPMRADRVNFTCQEECVWGADVPWGVFCSLHPCADPAPRMTLGSRGGLCLAQARIR
jgi:hypothetical protein